MVVNISQIAAGTDVESDCYSENKTVIQTRDLVFFCMANSLSGAIAICGNLLIILAVYKTTALQTPTNFFISSMSLADFLVGLVAVPLWMARAVLNITLNTHVLCLTSDFITIQTLMASTYSLCSVTADRYVAIISPYKYNHVITQNRCFAAILTAWAFTMVLASFRFLVGARSELPKFYVAAAVFGIGLPIVVICFCYAKIFKAAREQRRKISCLTMSVRADSLRQRKAAYTIAIVIGVYMIFWTPTFLVCFLDFTLHLCFYDAWLATVSISLANSALNPWIYAARNKQFWRAFKRLLRLL
ncbi:beta-1 adrenergic receptor-like [Oculina patagonica]